MLRKILDLFFPVIPKGDPLPEHQKFLGFDRLHSYVPTPSRPPQPATPPFAFREMACSGLSDTALRRRLINAVKGHRWMCTDCGNTEFIEREAGCWKCPKGEMVYIQVEPLKLT